MRLLAIALCVGLAASLPTQPVRDENIDIDTMFNLLGESVGDADDGLAAALQGVGVFEQSSTSSSSHTESSQSSSKTSYFISNGGDDIIEITVEQAAEYGLECVPAVDLTDSAKIIVEESIDEEAEEEDTAEGGEGAAAASGEGAAASSAAAGGAASSASASEGGVSSSAASGGAASSSAASQESAASSAAAGGAASSSAVGGEEGGAASSSAASGGEEVGGAASSAAAGGAASSSAASGGAASSSAASGGEEVGGAASSAAAGGAASSSAASGGAASSSAASGEEEVGGAASSAATGGAASSSAASGGAASSSAASGGEEVGGAASSAAAGGAASSSAASGGAASSSAASGGEGVGGAASSAATGGAASSSASSGEAASSSAAAGGAASTSAAAGETSSSSAASGAGAASSAAAGGAASSAVTVVDDDDDDDDDEDDDDEDGYEPSDDLTQDCVCVPYYLCKDGDIITDGAGLIDIRFGPSAEDEESKSNSQCSNFLDVCCTAPLSEPDPEITEDLIEEYVPSCGHRNPQGISVILDGFEEGESQFGEFPWMAIVLEDEEISYGNVIQRYVCGGSLIHPQVIMTGAHCVDGKAANKLLVRLGDWDTKQENEIFPHEQHRVSRVVSHEGFNGRTLFNDVALLFLAEPVELKQHIDTLCLPEPTDDFDYSSCVATGFGKDRFSGGSFQNIMKQVDLDVVPRKECQTKLRTTRLGRWFRLHKSFTCAGGAEGVDTCRGDGGSPLACPSKEDPNKYVQAGIVAWGIGCGEGGVPGVYASVPKLVPWVNAKIAEFFNAQPSPSVLYSPPV